MDRFAKVSLKAASDTRLGKNELRLLIALAGTADSKNRSHAKRSTLASLTGLPETRISTSAKKLAKLGWLEIKRRGRGISNVWQITPDKVTESVTSKKVTESVTLENDEVTETVTRDVTETVTSTLIEYSSRILTDAVSLDLSYVVTTEFEPGSNNLLALPVKPEKPQNQIAEAKDARALSGDTLPLDWRPHQAVYDLLLNQHGMPAGFIDYLIPEFCTYWNARGQAPAAGYAHRFVSWAGRAWLQQGQQWKKNHEASETSHARSHNEKRLERQRQKIRALLDGGSGDGLDGAGGFVPRQMVVGSG